MSEIDKKEEPPSNGDGDNPIISNSDGSLSENKTEISATNLTDETTKSGSGDHFQLTTATTVEDLPETTKKSTENTSIPPELSPSGTSDVTPGINAEIVSPDAETTLNNDKITPEAVKELIEQPTESLQDDLNSEIMVTKDHDSSGHDDDFILKWDDDDDDKGAEGKPEGGEVGKETEKELTELGLEVDGIANKADKSETMVIENVGEIDKIETSMIENSKASTEDEVNTKIIDDISNENKLLANTNLSQTESVLSKTEDVGIKEKTFDEDNSQVALGETMDINLETPIEESKIDNAVESNKELTDTNAEIHLDKPTLHSVAETKQSDANKDKTLDASDKMNVDTTENIGNLEKVHNGTENPDSLEKIDNVTEKMDVEEELPTNADSIEDKTNSKHQIEENTEVIKVTSSIVTTTTDTAPKITEDTGKVELVTENVKNTEVNENIDTDMVENAKTQVDDSINISLNEENVSISISEIANEEIAANRTVNENEIKIQALNITEDTEDFTKDISFDDIPRNHGVNKPDVMIEVPTQELIDLMDDSVNVSGNISFDKGETGIGVQHTSQLPDTSDAAEMADSLGLLAESSRVRVDDDDDQGEQETSEQDDDDDQFDGDDDKRHSPPHFDEITAYCYTGEDLEHVWGHPELKPPQNPRTPQIPRTAPSKESRRRRKRKGHRAGKKHKKLKKKKESSNQMALDQSEATIQQSDDPTSNVIETTKIEIAIPNEEEKEGMTADKEFEVKSDDQSDMDNAFGDEMEVTSDNIDYTNEADSMLEVDTPLKIECVVEESNQEVMNVTESKVTVDKVVSEGKADFDKILQAEDSVVKDEGKTDQQPQEQKQSPPKKMKLEISKPKNILNFIDLEESSDDEIQPVDVKTENDIKNILMKAEDSHEVEETSQDVEEVSQEIEKAEDKLSVNICKEIEVMSVGENTSDIKCKEGSTVITVPKPAVAKVARLNTSEVTIKTSSSPDLTVVIPEKKISESQEEPAKPKFGLEVFNLDSDEETTVSAISPISEKEKQRNRCVNSACKNEESSVPYYTADPSTVSYYDGSTKRKNMVCQTCAEVVINRQQKLIQGVKELTPFLQLEMKQSNHELVEISDSESDGEGEGGGEECERILQAGILEMELANMINDTWVKYKMDDRLKDTEKELEIELARLELDSAEVSEMLSECQLATDKLRRDLYATFELPRSEKPAIVIFDTPERRFSCVEPKQYELQPKRRLSSASESQAKKPANNTRSIPPSTDSQKGILYSKLSGSAYPGSDAVKMEEDKDVSVVRLSVESAPPDLPPPGDAVRAPLQVGMSVYAMKNAFGSWLKAKIVEFMPKQENSQFTMCRVRFENRNRNAFKVLPARCLAYHEPSNVRMTIGTRLIALFKDTTNNTKRESYYSGVVAEIANPVNKYRYLVFFDDGYAQYVRHSDTRLVCESSSLVWEEVHPFSREFVKQYLLTYPERPMVRLFTGQSIKTEWNGKWWVSHVVNVDASLVEVYFDQDKRTEWIYRGSTRLAPLYLELQAAEKPRNRPLPRNRMQTKLNMPYVEYTRSDEQDATKAAEASIKAQQEEIRRQRAVAKKSTAVPTPITPNSGSLDAVTSRVVYYTPKNAVRPYKLRAGHACGVACKRTDVLQLNELRTYNPLAKPLLSGWERQIVRFKGHKEVMYRAPCGRRIRNIQELHYYLRLVHSDMGVDLFDFGVNTHCLAEFVLNKCIVGKKDLSHGKENVPVPCVNYYDDSLPEFCSYNTERTPTAGVPLNLDPDFLCGCDCTDDCEDKTKCACWKLTLEGARTIGLEGEKVGYVYKRLAEPLPSGIYECNSRCKCKSTCLNRVAQHPLQLKLQVFKTLNRGWGIRALNDVPKGSFLCIYAGNLLTDATANLDGLNEGDEYLAELDYIEVVEQMKEGFEEDIPELDQKLDKKESGQSESEPEDESEEEEKPSKNEDEDGDFQPGFIGPEVTRFSKRLRKREKKDGVKKETEDQTMKKENPDDDCITISDDEELREPSRFAAQAGMGNSYVPKYKSVRSHFGKDEACYIMDAKVQGNIGRYLNHSCSPNVFVQNVFVDTHDPRFPWVAFFALSHIRAGTELTWNYNYDVGSVPGKALYCYCGAANCRGRLL